ncbi:MAG: sugar phosphate isomerase/epimerase [Streptococcaceae bacterium]|jgi:2-keto-myo-inositol isomerase|nr:sugar phosphate isomerase/epimerase [Streptococcaceae bacterium]
MKLCINEATCMNNSTLKKDLELAEKNGYDYIELRIDMLRNYLKTAPLTDLADFFNSHNLKPAGYNSIENINFTTQEEWEKIETDLLFACEAKRFIGGETIVVVPTIKSGMTYSESEIFEDSVKVLSKMSQIVKPYDMKIAFEPIGSEDCCVRSLSEGMKIIEAVDEANVGLVIDAFNLYLFEGWKDIDCLKRIPVEKIFCYHIDDSDDLPLNILDHCHRLFPSNGVIPLQEITRILKDIGYAGICSLELFNPSYWSLDPEEVFEVGAKKTKVYL